MVNWNSGVTEGGSSGSVLFEGSSWPNQLLVGVLTGGSSFCSAPNDPDLYGRFDLSYPSVSQYLGSGGGGNGPNAPTNMSNVVTPDGNGTFQVVLSWVAPATISVEGASAAASYILEADVVSGGKGLVDSNVGNVTSLTATQVPNNTYYARVRAVDANGQIGDASNQTTIVGNGGGCTAAPGAFTASSTVNGSTATVNWTAPPGGSNAATTYFLQAGSFAGGMDLVPKFDLGSANTSLVATGVAPGTYYVTLFAANQCGQTAAAEISIIV